MVPSAGAPCEDKRFIAEGLPLWNNNFIFCDFGKIWLRLNDEIRRDRSQLTLLLEILRQKKITPGNQRI